MGIRPRHLKRVEDRAGDRRVDARCLRRRLRFLLGGSAVAVLVGAAAVGTGRYRLERRIRGEIEEVLGSGPATRLQVVSEEHLTALPEPVRRWLRWSGAVGRPIPATVRSRQEGELRVGDLGWFPFTAEEYYSTTPPAFVWRAITRLAPGVPVVGKDSYLHGRGALEMWLLGLVPVARDSGPEMDQGDLLRYLNEIMWFPAAALNPEISWTPVDDVCVRATLSHGGLSGTATFFFDPDGRPTNMTAERHDREYRASVPWSTPISDYGEFDGVRVPTAGEALYVRPDGAFPYIRMRVTDVSHDVPERY